MVVKTPSPVSLLLTAESFLNIPKSELFILNSKPEIGASAFRGGIKKHHKNWTNLSSLLAWGGGWGARKCKRKVSSFISRHLELQLA